MSRAGCLLLALSSPLAAGFQVGGALAAARPATSAAHAPLFMVETKNKKDATELSFMDKMRGVVVKTDSPAAEEEVEDSKTMMQKVKDAGVAGIISYIFWEWAFWGVSVPVACFGFQVTKQNRERWTTDHRPPCSHP